MILNQLSALYRYRGFIVGSVQREFASRYRNSMLGAAWLVLQPLAQILVFTVVFSQVMKARLAGIESAFGYSIFLCAGILTWGLFSDMVGRFQNVFIENANLLKKLSFPRLCLPIVLTLNAGMNFAIIFTLFLLFLMLTGSFPGRIVLTILPILLLQIAFAVGLGMVIGVLNVFFRDIGQLMAIILQFWFWLTPIVYPLSTLPAWAQKIVMLNPMTPLIVAYQDVFVKGSQPVWTSLLSTLVLAIILCLLGMRLFQKHSGEMVDEL